MRNWFQAFAFKCNLYRYTEELPRLAKLVKDATGCDGVNIVQNNGADAAGLYKLNTVQVESVHVECCLPIS